MRSITAEREPPGPASSSMALRTSADRVTDVFALILLWYYHRPTKAGLAASDVLCQPPEARRPSVVAGAGRRSAPRARNRARTGTARATAIPKSASQPAPRDASAPSRLLALPAQRRGGRLAELHEEATGQCPEGVHEPGHGSTVARPTRPAVATLGGAPR